MTVGSHVRSPQLSQREGKCYIDFCLSFWTQKDFPKVTGRSILLLETRGGGGDFEELMLVNSLTLQQKNCFLCEIFFFFKSYEVAAAFVPQLL